MANRFNDWKMIAAPRRPMKSERCIKEKVLMKLAAIEIDPMSPIL